MRNAADPKSALRAVSSSFNVSRIFRIILIPIIIFFGIFCHAALALDIPDRPAPSWSYPANGDHPDWNQNLDGPTIVFLDVNGDGYDDLLLGYGHLDYESGEYEQNSSTILVFFGSADGLSAEPDQYLFRDDSSIFGQGIQNAGDVNADGISDLLIHDWNWPGGFGSVGRFFLFYGTPYGLEADTVEILTGNFQNRYYYSDSVASDIDINGDGYSDLVWQREIWNRTPEFNDDLHIIEAFYGDDSTHVFNAPVWDYDYDGIEIFGIIALGDVNGDKFDDFAICANGYGSQPVFLDIFHGSETGPRNQPDEIALSNPGADFPAWCELERAGDIDGDGNDDLWGYDQGTAEIYIFFGSSLGILPFRTQILPPPISGYAHAKYLGDINRDGYDDIAITMDRSIIRIMFGSATGVDTTSFWEYDWDDYTYSYIPYIGYDLGGEGGDVQNNGYADFAWTAQNYVGPGSYEMQTHVFFMSASTTSTSTTTVSSSTTSTTTTQPEEPDDDDTALDDDSGDPADGGGDDDDKGCCGY